jgi:hypothetical protein
METDTSSALGDMHILHEWSIRIFYLKTRDQQLQPFMKAISRFLTNANGASHSSL